MKKDVNSFIVNELINKNKHIHTALDQANLIIATLEEENSRLKDVLANLASLKNIDLKIISEDQNDRLCTV